jgi:hypothetical protein
MLKKFPYNWTLPIKRSFLVMSDSPGPDGIALGNRNIEVSINSMLLRLRPGNRSAVQ